MKRKASMKLVLLFAAGFCLQAGAQSQAGDSIPLRGEFHLAGERVAAVQYFEMESRLATHAPDGSITGTDIYRLSLKCTPAKVAGTRGDVYTCRRFTITLGNAPEVSIPSLEGWQYEFTPHPMERSPNGTTLGIPHEPFEALKDQNGKAVPVVNAYHVYNAFIDFHSFFIFADPTPSKGGIQDLSRIGQRIVHASANSQPATNLGTQVSEGSYFRNGEVTIELKGIGIVDGAPCAIVGFDSGASSFVMIMTPAPKFDVRTAGSSHYWGDIYKDLATNWVRKAVLTELVVSETTLPGQASTIKGVIERSILVRNVTQEGPGTDAG
jgi:hypothetical protein